MVDVDDHQRERPSPRCARAGPASRDGARDSGDCAGRSAHRSPPSRWSCWTLSRKLVGVALAPDLRAHPRGQLVAVDRPHQIVVDAEIEAADEPAVLVRSTTIMIGRRRVRSSERSWEHSRSPSKSARAEADDDEVVVALGGRKKASCGSLSTSTRVMRARASAGRARYELARSSTSRTRPLVAV